MTVLMGLICVVMVVVVSVLSICACVIPKVIVNSSMVKALLLLLLCFRQWEREGYSRGVRLTVLRPRLRVVHITSSIHIPCSTPSHITMQSCKEAGKYIQPHIHVPSHSSITVEEGKWLTITVFIERGQQFYFTVFPAGILDI